jgi:hypothetical protein
MDEQFGEKPWIKKMGKLYDYLMWKNAHWIEPWECEKYKKIVSRYKNFQSHLKSPQWVQSYKYQSYAMINAK